LGFQVGAKDSSLLLFVLVEPGTGDFTNRSLKPKIGCAIIRVTDWDLEETYMADIIVNLFAEIADFFISFWIDNVIDKFAKRNK